MALVKHISLKKSSAIYGRKGCYTYYLELDTESLTLYTAWVTRSFCGTYWELAIRNMDLEQVYQFPFETKRDCLTFLKRDFDSAEYTREAFVESERHQSW